MIVGLALLIWWRVEFVMHRRRVDALEWRIHVNGIRGKSTVTRILAGMLREAGYGTIGKSTGTAAAVITNEGHDEPIVRKGPATILEQIEIVKEWVTDDIDALVIECMALRPEYQHTSETQIVKSNIGVLTNVREDHQDVMGETLKEIAVSLMSTCPINGTLITAEQDPAILRVIKREAAKRNTEVIVADPNTVTDEEIARFDYIAFKDNVAIGLVLARMLDIPRDVAMKGMVEAAPDPGVLRMKDLLILGKHVTWANLFAVNDRESMMVAFEKLRAFVTPQTTIVGILNNRADRELRAIQFADVAVRDLRFDRLVTFGAYEGLVTDRLVENGYRLDHILNLGDSTAPSVDRIVQRMIGDMPTSHVLVVGFVNIHTHQAEEMLEYFEHQAEPWTEDVDASPARDGAPELPRRTPPTKPATLPRLFGRRAGRRRSRFRCGLRCRRNVLPSEHADQDTSETPNRRCQTRPIGESGHISNARLPVLDRGRAVRLRCRGRRLDGQLRAPTPHDRFDRGPRLHRDVPAAAGGARSDLPECLRLVLGREPSPPPVVPLVRQEQVHRAGRDQHRTADRHAEIVAEQAPGCGNRTSRSSSVSATSSRR